MATAMVQAEEEEEEEEDEFEFQSFLNGDCVSKLSIAATGDEYQIGKEGGFYYDPNPTINDTVKRTKSNNHSSIDSSSSNIGFEDSRIVNESNSTTIASDSSCGVKRIHPSPKAIFSEFKPIHQLLDETADVTVDDNNIKGSKSKDSSCSEDDEEGKAVVNDTATAAQSRPKISFQIVNPKLKKKKKKDIKNMTSNVTQEQQQEQQHQQQQQQQSKIVGVEEEESFDFTTINDKDFIASWMTMLN